MPDKPEHKSISINFAISYAVKKRDEVANKKPLLAFGGSYLKIEGRP